MMLSLVAGSANPLLAEDLSAALSVPLVPRILERFADSELHVELQRTVRGHDVYVLQSTSPPVDEHLLELFFIADACRRAGAGRLTAVLPYFGYARQDRRARGREPVGAHVVAGMIEAAGFHRVIAIDLHTPAIEGFFQVPLEHLTAAPLLAQAVHASRNTVIVAPDLGAVKLAERYQTILDCPIAVLHKTRLSGENVSVRSIIGDVKGRAPHIVDDMISTAGTIEAAVRGLFDAGCTSDVTVAATHALLVGPAFTRLAALPIRELLTTNSVTPLEPMPIGQRVLDVAPLLADVILRLAHDRSLEPVVVHR
jgi:ribose-phosphate pyrophosphokinase